MGDEGQKCLVAYCCDRYTENKQWLAVLNMVMEDEVQLPRFAATACQLAKHLSLCTCLQTVSGNG